MWREKDSDINEGKIILIKYLVSWIRHLMIDTKDTVDKKMKYSLKRLTELNPESRAVYFKINLFISYESVDMWDSKGRRRND